MSFYNRREWFELRYRVLRAHGYRCMACGISKDDGAVIQVDHILPVSIYPEKALDESNLQVLCKPCNFGKSNVFTDDLRIARPSWKSAADARARTSLSPGERKNRRRAYAMARFSNWIKKKLHAAEQRGLWEDQMRWTQAYLEISRKLSTRFAASDVEGA